MNWSAAGTIVGIIGAVAAGVAAFVHLQRDIADLKETVVPQSFAKGFVFLSESACPTKGFIDVTENLDGLYIIAATQANGTVYVRQGKGAHEHSMSGTHSHKVTGKTGPLGGGERYGSNDRNAAHKNNRADVTGTAHSEDSGHTHAQGEHEHGHAGFRLCRYIGVE